MVSCKTIPLNSPSVNKDFLSSVLKKTENKGAEFFSTEKVDVRVKTEDQKSFKAKVYIKKNQYIYINLNFLGFEFARAELSQDSIKFINRIDRTFYFGAIDDLKSLYGIDLTYFQIETLILKGIVYHEGDTRKALKSRISGSDSGYVYSFIDKNGNSVTSVFDKENFMESALEISDKNKSFQISAKLADYSRNKTYPGKISILIANEKLSAEIFVTIQSISNSEFKRRIFEINSKYREIDF